MKSIVYGIAFIFSLFAVYSHFIMDNWHLPYLFIVISLIAAYNFRLSTLSHVIINRVFISLAIFYIFYFLNLTFTFDIFYMDSWSFKNMRIEFIGLIISLIIFLLILGQRNSALLFQYFYAFITITFILELITHFTDYHSIYNKNYYGYHAFLLLFYFNIKKINNLKLFYLVSLILLLITYFSFYSRATTVSIFIYLFIYSFSNYLFKTGFRTLIFSLLFFFSIGFSIYYYSFSAIDNSTILEYNFSGEKGFFGRLGIWLELLEHIIQKPWIGYGSNISSEYMFSNLIQRNLSSHNTYLDILFRMGITGFLIVILLFSQIIKYFYINRKSIYAPSGFAFLFSTLFMAAGYEIIFFVILPVNLFFWSGIAFLINSIEIKKKLKNK